MQGNMLEIKDLSKKYEQFQLQNVNLNLPKGAIMGFVGENGAGKTTTIKLILNMIQKDTGNIKVFGLDHIRNEMEIKEKIGVVLDEGFFYENFNSKQINKVMKQMYRNWNESTYTSYLKEFKLPQNKPIKEYSKGMKMKLSIAAALSHNPQLLILDEPTSGLDPIVRNEILDIFMNFIQDEEKAILFSSHITSDLDKIADYITFIHEGKIVFTKTKDELNEYGVLKCGLSDAEKIDKKDQIGIRKNKFGCEILVENRGNMKVKYPSYPIDSTTIEEIMLFITRGN